MTLDQMYEYIASDPPTIIYLSGKTCTGKSTISKNFVNKFNYKVIELDKIVRESVIKPLELLDEGKVFNEVYRNRDKSEWISMFVKETISLIDTSIQDGNSVIIEGAISNPYTLQDIFGIYKEFTFIYIHPTNIDNYIRNITSRFILADENNNASLPHRFWTMVDQNEFKEYCHKKVITDRLASSISSYAELSQSGSVTRLNNFRQYFSGIIEVNS